MTPGRKDNSSRLGMVRTTQQWWAPQIPPHPSWGLALGALSLQETETLGKAGGQQEKWPVAQNT